MVQYRVASACFSESNAQLVEQPVEVAVGEVEDLSGRRRALSIGRVVLDDDQVGVTGEEVVGHFASRCIRALVTGVRRSKPT
jgi:hypothetical protein